jgi:hypothetical protein
MKNLVQNPVTDVEITGPVTVSNEVEVKNDSGNPIPVVTGLEIPEHDYIDLSYTGSNLTGVVYKTGGSAWHHGGDADLGVRRQRQPDLRHQELSHGSQVQPIYRQP